MFQLPKPKQTQTQNRKAILAPAFSGSQPRLFAGLARAWQKSEHGGANLERSRGSSRLIRAYKQSELLLPLLLALPPPRARGSRRSARKRGRADACGIVVGTETRRRIIIEGDAIIKLFGAKMGKIGAFRNILSARWRFDEFRSEIRHLYVTGSFRIYSVEHFGYSVEKKIDVTQCRFIS